MFELINKEIFDAQPHTFEKEPENIFKFKNITLLNDDCLNPNIFNSEFIDLIVTSPPYNVGIEYNSNDDELNYNDYLEFSTNKPKNASTIYSSFVVPRIHKCPRICNDSISNSCCIQINWVFNTVNTMLFT